MLSWRKQKKVCVLCVKVSSSESDVSPAIELTKAIKDKEAVKSQAEAVSREYDRLLDEYSRMEKKLAILKNDDPSDKKSD